MQCRDQWDKLSFHLLCAPEIWILSKTCTHTMTPVFTHTTQNYTRYIEPKWWIFNMKIYQFVLFERTVCRIAVSLFTLIFIGLSLTFKLKAWYWASSFWMCECDTLLTVNDSAQDENNEIEWKQHAHTLHMIIIHVFYCVLEYIGLEIQWDEKKCMMRKETFHWNILLVKYTPRRDSLTEYSMLASEFSTIHQSHAKP